MKKLGLIILVLVCMAAVAIGVTLIGPWLPKKAYPIESVLPEGPLWFSSATDVEKNIQKFTTTRFWQNLRSLNYKTLLEESGAKPEDITVYESFITQLSLPENQKILSNFFGQEISVAVYPTEITGLTPEAFQEMAGGIFFVTRLKPEARFSELITGFMARLSPDVRIVPVKYKNHTIMMAAGKNESLTIGYVTFNNLLVFGIGDRAAKDSIDAFIKNRKSLAEDQMYVKTRGHFLPGADVVSFINFDRIVSLLKNQLLKQSASDAKAPAYQEQLARTFRQMEGFQSFGYSGSYEKFWDLKVDVHFDKAKLDPAVAAMYNCPPGENQSLSFIPQNVVGYQWNNCYDLKSTWQQAQSEMAEAAQGAGESQPPTAMIAAMEQSLGLSIQNDIIPAFGDEFGGALADIKITEAFPLPQLLFFVETASQEKAEQVLSTLLAKQPMIQPQTENYNDIAIKYVTLPLLAASLEPGYAYIDNYLVLTTDRQFLKQAIDTKKKVTDPLSGNSKLKEISFNLAENSNSTFFLDFEQLMQKMDGVVDWVTQWVSAQDAKREAFKAGSEKRLADLEAEIETKNSELRTLQGELQAQQAVPAGVPVSDSVGTEALSGAAVIEEQLRLKEKEIGTDKEKIEELKYVIDQYSQPMDTQADVKVMQEFVKPLVKALQFLRVFASTAQIKDTFIETKAHWDIQ